MKKQIYEDLYKEYEYDDDKRRESRIDLDTIDEYMSTNDFPFKVPDISITKFLGFVNGNFVGIKKEWILNVYIKLGIPMNKINMRALNFYIRDYNEVMKSQIELVNYETLYNSLNDSLFFTLNNLIRVFNGNFRIARIVLVSYLLTFIIPHFILFPLGFHIEEEYVDKNKVKEVPLFINKILFPKFTKTLLENNLLQYADNSKVNQYGIVYDSIVNGFHPYDIRTVIWVLNKPTYVIKLGLLWLNKVDVECDLALNKSISEKDLSHFDVTKLINI